MGLSQALIAAASGLHATQAGLSIVAGNVANANTPGYVRKSINQISTSDAKINERIRNEHAHGVQHVRVMFAVSHHQ